MSKPLLYICDFCRSGYPLRQQSTIRLYLVQSLVDHVETTCPYCRKKMRLWELHETAMRSLLQEALDSAIQIRVDFEPNDPTWEKYCAESHWLNQPLAEELP